MQSQSSEAEAAATAAQALLESTQAEAAATLITTRASLQAALEAAETELAALKVLNRDAAYFWSTQPRCKHIVENSLHLASVKQSLGPAICNVCRSQ